MSWGIFSQTVSILNHPAEKQGLTWRLAVGSPLPLAVCTKAAHSQQQQRGQARMWPPSSFCRPGIAQQPRPPGANTIHNTNSPLLVCHSSTNNKQTARHTYFFLASSYCQFSFTLSTKYEESWETYWREIRRWTRLHNTIRLFGFSHFKFMQGVK